MLDTSASMTGAFGFPKRMAGSVVSHGGGRVTRHITRFGRGLAPMEETELLINSGAGLEYSPEFRALLAGFYLAL